MACTWLIVNGVSTVVFECRNGYTSSSAGLCHHPAVAQPSAASTQPQASNCTCEAALGLPVLPLQVSVT